MPAEQDEVRAAYERDLLVYTGTRHLEPPEQVLLRRFKGSWHRMSMLDVGVGGGRTSFTFAAVAGRYLGVDFAPTMIEHARAHVPEDDTVSFRVADVRDLSGLRETFDVVLFSCNGLDSLDHADRLEALRQMRSVLRPDGLLVFSSHSLHGLRRWLPIRDVPRALSARAAYRFVWSVPKTVRVIAAKRRLDFDAVERTGWARLNDGTHTFEWCYVTVAEQRRQLAEVGLQLAEVLDPAGRTVDPARPGDDLWLHFVSTPVPIPSSSA